jgi:hypothetical protein
MPQLALRIWFLSRCRPPSFSPIWECPVYINLNNRFANQKALDSHKLSKAYKTMQTKGAELGLLLALPDVKVLEACGGFGLRVVEGLFGAERARGM